MNLSGFEMILSLCCQLCQYPGCLLKAVDFDRQSSRSNHADRRHRSDGLYILSPSLSAIVVLWLSVVLVLKHNEPGCQGNTSQAQLTS